MADQQVQSPTLEELPKVQSDLKSQLEHFDQQSLKNIEPQEKVVLPTAEGNQTIRFNYHTIIVIICSSLRKHISISFPRTSLMHLSLDLKIFLLFF